MLSVFSKSIRERLFRPLIWHQHNYTVGNCCSGSTHSTNSRLSSKRYRNRRREETSLNPYLANFDDNERHVVGEGSVAPSSYAVEDCPLHFRQCQRRRFVNQVFQTLHAEHVIGTVKNLDESIRVEN